MSATTGNSQSLSPNIENSISVSELKINDRPDLDDWNDGAIPENGGLRERCGGQLFWLFQGITYLL